MTFQEQFERSLEAAPRVALVQILAKQSEEAGVKLTDEQWRELYEHIRVDEDAIQLTGPITFDGQRMDLALNESDMVAVEACMNRLSEKMPSLLVEIGNAVGDDLLGTLRDRWPEQEQIEDQDRRAFVRRLHERWGSPISLLRMMLTISREFGEMTSRDIARLGQDVALRHRVLTRLHARSCQVFDEVVCHLANGFADGAMARWRTLHEIAVVAMFIRKEGEGTARRFLDHQSVETFNAAKSYRRFSSQLGYAPMTDEDFEASKLARDETVAKYEHEPQFDSDYGWAAEALGIERPHLLHIEESVGLDHFRPYYKLACQNVHASSKGSIERLGMPGGSDALLAGPSNAGLSDPGQNSAISLYRSSLALGLLVPTMDSLVVLRVLAGLVDDACQSFHAAHEQLKKDVRNGADER